MVTKNSHCFSCQAIQCSFTPPPPNISVLVACQSKTIRFTGYFYTSTQLSDLSSIFPPSDSWSQRKCSSTKNTQLVLWLIFVRLTVFAAFPVLLAKRLQKSCKIVEKNLEFQCSEPSDISYYRRMVDISLSYCTNMTDIAQVCLFNTFW